LGRSWRRLHRGERIGDPLVGLGDPVQALDHIIDAPEPERNLSQEEHGDCKRAQAEHQQKQRERIRRPIHGLAPVSCGG
jgi:hypothetical protein